MNDLSINNQQASESYTEAIKLHAEIMANGELCATALFEVCRCLKEMRDKQLYKELNYDTFDEYCEQMAGIKARQAYTYISTYERLGSSVLQSNANLGITKLALISGMNPSDRIDALASGELEEMSVQEIKDLVAKSKQQGEQITFLESECQKLDEFKSENAIEVEELRAANEKLLSEKAEVEAELSGIRSKPVEVAVQEPSAEDIEKIKTAARKEAEKELIAKQKEKIDKAVDKAKADAAAEAKKQADLAAQKAREQAEAESKSKISELENAIKYSNEQTANLEKQLKLSNSDSATAAVYFDSLQNDYNKLISVIEKMPEGAAGKYRAAVKQALTIFLGNLDSEE